ncbi:kelch-like protein 8 [Dorcoceras hygrometricum]|uniref:Kelch-like protein 8 n=1 Tax=Dorcoceras hygrometricum TaxID=472368 RepID=A0A2Z7DJV5_9LAMI|nr:kelch-like protein 8 [Dorcoceras hygrometricum]
MGGRRRREACGRGWAAMRASTCVTLNGSGIHLAVGPQRLWLRNHNIGLAQRIMVKRLATSRHDPLGITDSACQNQLVVVSVQYGPFNTYIPIGSTTIGKSRVARDPIAMHTYWRSNSDITSVTSIGYPRMKGSGESSTTKHRLLHASGPHPIPLTNDPKGVGKRVKVRRLSCRVSMTFRVVRTNHYNQDLDLIHSTNGNHLESPNEGSSIDHQVTIHLHAQNITMLPTNETWYFTSQMLVSSYNQDLDLIHSTNGNHLESPNEGSSIDHQVTIHLHAQNITMLPTNETWYFTSQMLVSSSSGLILILTAQSTRNEFRMHSNY